MSKNDMPAAEANESVSYELAFHVLPTVAEGEVSVVFDKIKAAITQAGAELTDEEAPERFDLAYEIIKYLEGRNRKFTSAYFGWVRFNAQVAHLDAINESVEGMNELLRHLLIKLTKVEEANPFRFHEALEVKQVETVEENVEAPAEEAKEEKKAEVENETEETPKEEAGEETKETV